MRPLSAIIFLTTAVHAQFLPGVDPRVPEAKPVESLPPVRKSEPSAGAGGILCHQLKEIRLETRFGGELTSLGQGLSAASDLYLPSPKTLGGKLAPWRGKSLTTGDLVAIADTILMHYDTEGYPVAGIDVPEQDLSSGRLRFVVEIGRIGKVGVSRPKYGDPKALVRGLRLRSGAILRRAEIDEQMAWYGRSVFRRPQLFVSPGTEPATADLLIGLAEKKPWRVTLGYENSGPTLLGLDRFILGVAGMTENEHVLAYQALVGAPVSSLQAHALSWEMPFQRLHQTMQLDAVYAEVLTKSDLSGLPVENRGTSWSLAAIQKLSLPAIGKWRQRIAAGLEIKATDQFVLFGGAQFSPGGVRLVDAKVTYAFSRDWDNGGVAVEASGLGSPGGLGSGNDDADFTAYDPQADASYLIGRLSGQAWWSPVGDWRLALRSAAQVADSRLLPVEQFAAGGYQTVRGVAEREYFADGGSQSSLELYTPEFTWANRYQVRVLGFYDQAWLKSRGANADFLAGAGVGVRLKLMEHADLRADHGWRLDDHGSQTHVGLQISF